MAGMACTGTSVFPFSQLRTVHSLTSSRSPVSRCVSPKFCRRARMCSPRFDGGGSSRFGFRPLSRTETFGKKATRACPCGHCGDRSGRCRCTPKRVARAREVQLARQGTPNALLGTRDIDRHCGTDRDGDQLLRHALARLLLSARAYHRVLRVARSIADLAGKGTIAAEHIAEAIQYRRLDASF